MGLDFYIYLVVDEDGIARHDVPDSAHIDFESTPLVEAYWANITHNLTGMAKAADIYDILWRPGYEFTKITPEITRRLGSGYSALISDPAKFREYNAPNGWGMYCHFVPFVAGILDAFKAHPAGWAYRSV